jgi:glutamate 5-kinase
MYGSMFTPPKNRALAHLSQRCAQVLLCLDNLANRGQYINARNTFIELLAYGTVPVVNENVCVTTCMVWQPSSVPHTRLWDTVCDNLFLWGMLWSRACHQRDCTCAYGGILGG